MHELIYPVLFEQRTAYAAPEFALLEEASEDALVLFHVPSLLNYLKAPPSLAPFEDVVAGFIQTTDSKNKCLGALQVAIVVASPRWKGAGITIYALASDFYGAPLTSDRVHSSSVAARKTWAKIEHSPEWKLAGEELDNYGEVDSRKTYVNIVGTHPSRGIDVLDGPKTSIEIDDCPLPSKADSVKDISKMAELVGAANAYRYVGSLRADPLIQNAERVLSDVPNNPKKLNPRKVLVNMGHALFSMRYEGK